MDNKELIKQISKTFHSVILEWPEKIIIQRNREYPRNFISLADAWDKVEDIIGTSDPWKELMVWTIYGLLHTKAIELTSTNNGAIEIIPKDLNIEDVLSNYIESLDSDEWSFLFNEYPMK